MRDEVRSPVAPALWPLAAGLARVRRARTQAGTARLERHLDAVLRPQGDEPDRLDHVTGRELEPGALGGHRDDDLRLRDGKPVADADARSAAERQVGEAMALRDGRRREPLGIE